MFFKTFNLQAWGRDNHWEMFVAFLILVVGQLFMLGAKKKKKKNPERSDHKRFAFCLFFHWLQPGFYKGVAGSQVTLSSLVNQSRAMLEEQGRHLLTEAERQTMSYYVEEYRDGHIGIEPLVMALFELLNTHAKVG